MQRQIKQNPSKKVYKAWGTSTPAALSSADPPRCYCRRVRLRWHTDDQSWIPTLATSWHHFRLPLFDIFCKTDSKMILLEHLRYSFKPMFLWLFFLYGPKRACLSFSPSRDTKVLPHWDVGRANLPQPPRATVSRSNPSQRHPHPSKFTVDWADWYE